MPKYLMKASFTPEGIRGVLKDGGTGRRSAVDQSAASIGGKVEAFYFAFGTTDTYTILDLPSNADMVALAATVAATGAVKIETVVLLTPKEIDEACKKTVSYRPPGA
jgi:uncharacterized protein with GYD domain